MITIEKKSYVQGLFRCDCPEVYLREKGIFYPLDKNLESQAREQAEQGLLDWALQHNILEKAEQNTALEMERFLRALGFQQVTIIFEKVPH